MLTMRIRFGLVLSLAMIATASVWGVGGATHSDSPSPQDARAPQSATQPSSQPGTQPAASRPREGRGRERNRPVEPPPPDYSPMIAIGVEHILKVQEGET